MPQWAQENSPSLRLTDDGHAVDRRMIYGNPQDAARKQGEPISCAACSRQPRRSWERTTVERTRLSA